MITCLYTEILASPSQIDAVLSVNRPTGISSTFLPTHTHVQEYSQDAVP